MGLWYLSRHADLPTYAKRRDPVGSRRFLLQKYLYYRREERHYGSASGDHPALSFET